MALLSRNLDVKKICLRVGAVWVEIIRIKSRKSDSTKDKGREREREGERIRRNRAPLDEAPGRRPAISGTIQKRKGSLLAYGNDASVSDTRRFPGASERNRGGAFVASRYGRAYIWKRLSGAWRSRLMKNECVCSPRHRSLRYQDVSTAFSRRFATQ